MLEDAVGDDRVDGRVAQHREAGAVESVNPEPPLADEVPAHPLAHSRGVVDDHELLAAANQVSG